MKLDMPLNEFLTHIAHIRHDSAAYVYAAANAISHIDDCHMYGKYISPAKVVWEKTYNDGDISFETFCTLSKQCCIYCGKPPSNMHNHTKSKDPDANFYYTGLDRVDSTLGHILGNVVPCCSACNYMKNALAVEMFLEQVRLINLNFISRTPSLAPRETPRMSVVLLATRHSR
jgi:hypothetical protein